MTKYLCTKVRDAGAAYVDPNDKKAMPVRGVQVHLTPVISQHELDGGILEMRLTTMHTRTFQEGKTYEF